MGQSAIASELFARGFAVLPAPARVELGESCVPIGPAVAVATGRGVKGDDIAVASLCEQVAQRTGAAVTVGGSGNGLPVRLAIADKTVAADAVDAIRRQGYELRIGPEGVALTANASAGLFYGVQTLVQLLKHTLDRGWVLPAGRVEDWPDLELRLIHYDTKLHQERFEAVQRLIDRVAHFKINGICWEIEDKFAYERHPLIAAPGAFTAEQMRRLTAYALARHVQIIPILQMPSHNGFIGKHAAYAHLREHPENNYMLCVSNPQTIQLYRELIGELVAATPGCRFFHLGTDEPYFLGEGPNCPCVAKLPRMGKGGIMAEFITTMATLVSQEFGREVMYWGERPMDAPDVVNLPPGTINAVQQSEAMSATYRRRGIRELCYNSTQGMRPWFPDYWRVRSGHVFDGAGEGRLDEMTRKIRTDGHRENNVTGSLIAAWDDAGLHCETFLLGYVTASAVGWNPAAPSVDEAVACFMHQFYGPGARGMVDAYRRLDELADFWTSSWDRVPSRRGPAFMPRWHQRTDLTLGVPNLPDADTLDHRPFWRQRYGELARRAGELEGRIERLIGLLGENLLCVERNRHSVEVLLSIGRMMRHHVMLLRTLWEAEGLLDEARQAWAQVRPSRAASLLRSAARRVRDCVRDRQQAFAALVTTWEKARLPKGAAVDGKSYVHIHDTTKDHFADRTADLSYLIGPELGLGLDGWADRLAQIAEQFASAHGHQKPKPEHRIE